jgi:hypothetical protein
MTCQFIGYRHLNQPWFICSPFIYHTFIPITHDSLAQLPTHTAWQTHSHNGQCSQSHFLQVYEQILSDGVSARRPRPRPRHLRHLIVLPCITFQPHHNHPYHLRRPHISPRRNRKPDISGVHRHQHRSGRSGLGVRTRLRLLRSIELAKLPRGPSQRDQNED